MKSKDGGRSCDTAPGDGNIERPLPEVHVGGEKIGAEISEKVQWQISENEEDNDDCHRADDGAHRIFRQG